jgi:hypothetical protein
MNRLKYGVTSVSDYVKFDELSMLGIGFNLKIHMHANGIDHIGLQGLLAEVDI